MPKCEGESRLTGERCGRPAMAGSRYCNFHGGKSPAVHVRRLGRTYSRYLGPKLKDFVEEVLDHPMEEQVQVLEELALMRAAAVETVKLCTATMESDTVDSSTKALAIETLKGALNEVRDMAMAAARIESMSNDKVSITAINLVVVQVVKVIKEVVNDEALAIKIADAIEETVRLPDPQRDPNVELQAVPDTLELAKMMDESVANEE